MPTLLMASLLTASTASFAVAAGPDPKRLVLRPADVPAGFASVPGASRYVPNAALAGATAARLVTRSQRVTGYQAQYQQRRNVRVSDIVSRADLFKNRVGARFFLDWMDRDQRRSNAARIRGGADPYTRLGVSIGAEAWIYSQALPANYVLLAWRYGRVVSWIHTWGLGVTKTLTLARRQQHRVDSATG